MAVNWLKSLMSAVHRKADVNEELCWTLERACPDYEKPVGAAKLLFQKSSRASMHRCKRTIVSHAITFRLDPVDAAVETRLAVEDMNSF